MTLLLRLAALCCLLLPAPAALSARLEIPLRVPFEIVRQALLEQIASASGAPDVIYREGACRYLKLHKLDIVGRDGQLHLSGPGTAALGMELLGQCQNAAAWQGTMELVLLPHVDSAGRLRVRVVDSQLRDAGNAPALGFIWELTKRQLHPRLEQFSYDIGALRSALLAVVRSVAPPQHVAELERTLSQLALLAPRVESNAIIVPVVLEIPDAWLAPPPSTASGAPLTEDELEALDTALQPWDAFLAYSIKQVAVDHPDSMLRKRLFTLLLDSRHQLSAILAGEAQASGDPVRALFIDTWNELRPILAEFAPYAMFIDAGDALLALDRAAPGFEMRLSEEALRQLARSLRPGFAGDPLRYDWAIDPQLRRLFEVGEIVPVRTSSLPGFIRTAQSTNARALDRWIPTRAELAAYEARLGDLLHRTAASELQRTTLPAPYDGIYRHLVPTTALIESCWRQYALRAGKVSYLRSAAASVGVMQVNQRVWRGFYDVERLRWETAYNARAGAQILMRYVRDYAIPYAERSGNPDHVPRAAYAVYNGGPRAVGRFAKAKPHPREQRVDEHLWALYRGIASGGRADLATCGVRQD
jgi:hypothetical protein